MAEFNSNLWAPWRMEYIGSFSATAKERGCFLCRYAQEPERDAANHVIWRNESCFTVFNQYPYSNGHLMAATLAHVGNLYDVPDAVLTQLMCQVRDAQRLLTATSSAHGFNVGINIGRCAGAGLPDHLHMHIVPRWEGDTNFMSVCGDARVISQSIDALHEKMRVVVKELGLPPVRE